MNINEIYPCTIIKDRYYGIYSGGKWTAWNIDAGDIPSGQKENDMSCAEFWDDFNSDRIGTNNWFGQKVFVGKGASPSEALEDLARKIIYGRA